MKRYILLLAALVVPLLTNAQEAAPTEAAPAVKGPTLQVDQPEFDFGSADSQATVEHTYILKNTGDTTLEISSVRPACGCTVAELTEKMIPPGGESRLTAKLSLRGRSGRQSKSITINSNDPERPQMQLMLVGNVSQSIQIAPDRLIFGQMAPGQEITLYVELASMSEKDFQILKIETNNPELIGTPETVEPGKKYRIGARFKAPQSAGPLNALLRITTDHPDRQLIEIPMAANVVGELVFAPAEIVLPATGDGSPQTRYVVIRKGSASSFEITEIVTPAPDIKTTTLPFADQGFRIQLENIVPSADLNGKEFIIRTTAPSMGEIRIPVRVAD